MMKANNKLPSTGQTCRTVDRKSHQQRFPGLNASASRHQQRLHYRLASNDDGRLTRTVNDENCTVRICVQMAWPCYFSLAPTPRLHVSGTALC